MIARAKSSANLAILGFVLLPAAVVTVAAFNDRERSLRPDSRDI